MRGPNEIGDFSSPIKEVVMLLSVVLSPIKEVVMLLSVVLSPVKEVVMLLSVVLYPVKVVITYCVTQCCLVPMQEVVI